MEPGLIQWHLIITADLLLYLAAPPPSFSKLLQCLNIYKAQETKRRAIVLWFLFNTKLKARERENIHIGIWKFHLVY